MTEQKQELHIIGYCRFCNNPILSIKNFIIPEEVGILLHKSCWKDNKDRIIEEWGE